MSLRIQSFSAPTKKFPFISQDHFFVRRSFPLFFLSAKVSSKFQQGEILLKGGKSVFSTLQETP